MAFCVLTSAVMRHFNLRGNRICDPLLNNWDWLTFVQIHLIWNKQPGSKFSDIFFAGSRESDPINTESERRCWPCPCWCELGEEFHFKKFSWLVFPYHLVLAIDYFCMWKKPNRILTSVYILRMINFTGKILVFSSWKLKLYFASFSKPRPVSQSVKYKIPGQK